MNGWKWHPLFHVAGDLDGLSARARPTGEGAKGCTLGSYIRSPKGEMAGAGGLSGFIERRIVLPVGMCAVGGGKEWPGQDVRLVVWRPK